MTGVLNPTHTAQPYAPTWITIPAGPFLMGSDPRAAARPYANERPQQQLTLPTFAISRVPITNAQYAQFIAATGHPAPAHWPAEAMPTALAHHPVTHVDWDDAQAFCTWAGVRLPTKAEWEKAARGPAAAPDEAPVYPWGNDLPDAIRLNYRRTGKGKTTSPVGRYPRGASVYGVLDLAENVWEWVSSAYAPYPYQADDGREDPTCASQRVLRGGSFLSPSARFVRCAMRSLSYPTRRREHIGFRVAHGGKEDADSRG
ncbi:MAG: SUMF1/EgtB/PvdO family nonheme iron enzyme [Caldilineaceae bacterium]|nr:SUMF1/EgtB/PvdO family nonheme iron enzyme [Caldilineaceae bacterium]